MDLAFETAASLAARIRRREVSSEALLDQFLGRIAEKNPALNAVVTLDAGRARERARAADEALARGEIWGPLHGLPMTVKDTLETAGLRTTAGYEPLSAHVPEANAVVVQRLLDAGAVVFGKTNTPVLAGDWQSVNPIFGRTNNPWDTERTPGGSSGGSAAAVAAGLTALEIGSDIGGSIRVPAHWCGVYGLKPTHGVIPLRGHIPGPPGTLAEIDLAVVGPIARSAADLDLALGLVAGPLPDRARAWRLDLPPPRHETLRGFRVAAWLDDPAYPVAPEVGERLHDAIAALGRAGARIDERARPGFPMEEVVDVYGRLLWPILLAGYPPEDFDRFCELAANAPSGAGDPLTRLVRAGTARTRDWLRANEHRERLRARMAVFFEEFDVLLMPVNQVPAIPHDPSEPQAARTIRVGGEERPYFDLFSWIALATTTLLPAVAAPCGRTPGGLPVGLQIVAPYLEDRTSIAFAGCMAEIVGAFEAPLL